MSAVRPRVPGPAGGPGTDPQPPPPAPAPAPPRVVLHTRPGCHLCDLARQVVADVCAGGGTTWGEVDVDSPSSRSDGLHERWTDLVPVVTVDGRHHAHFRVDPAALARALAPGGPQRP